MKRFEKFAVFVAFVLALSVLSSGQITIPHTFTTSVPVSQLNTNLSTLGTGALNRAGGNLTGNITANAGVTIDGVDVGDKLGGSGTGAFATVTTSNTGASSVDIAGGITVGTGNVALVNTSGKIAALSSTYLADLSASNLTIGAVSVPTYIWSSGTYTPTWSGGGVSIGNGSIYGRWQKTGKTIHVQIYLTGGSTTNWGGATGWTLSVPEIGATDTVAYGGTVFVVDNSAALIYSGIALLGSGATSFSMYPTTAGSAGPFNSTYPITWATSDYIIVSLTYQTAS